MRPLPGAARMYPETDVPPVVITEERIQSIKLPELIGERKVRYIKQFGLNEELANQIARSGNFVIFDRIMQQVLKANPNSVVRVLETILYELEKEGIDITKITEDHLIELFRLQSEGKIPNEAISNILKTIAAKPESGVETAARSLGIGGVEKGELETAVEKLIEEKMDFIKGKGMNAVGPLMGLIMKDFRGKVSGEEVSKLLNEKISKEMDTK
jgi:glutamyl-tRNA(Gln) amidotransferase subunit E